MLSLLFWRSWASKAAAASSGPEFDEFGNEVGAEVTLLERRFAVAAGRLARLAARQNENTLLFLYARYKQATLGPAAAQPPDARPTLFFGPAAKRKWAAWESLGTMAPETAMREYVDRMCELDPSLRNADDESQEEGGGGSGFGAGVSRLAAEEEDTSTEDEADIFWAVKKLEKPGEMSDWLKRHGKEAVAGRDAAQMTALHWAVDRNRPTNALALIAAGADVNAQDGDGQTPLHFAVSCEHWDLARLLLSEGADSHILDKDGLPPVPPALLLKLSPKPGTDPHFLID